MDNKRKVGWSGLGLSTFVAIYLALDFIAKIFGIINIPKDARENLTFVHEHSGVFALAALLLGAMCTAYLYKDGAFSALRSLRTAKMEAVIVIFIGLATVALGVTQYFRVPSAPAEPVQPLIVYTIPPEMRDGIVWSAQSVAINVNYSEDKPFIIMVGLMGKNTGENFIELKRARMISSTTSEQFDLVVYNVQPPAQVSEVNPVPPGAEFQLATEFNIGGALENRLSLDEFVKRFGVFRFLIEYGSGNTVFSKEVTPAMIREELARQRATIPGFMRPQEPKPQVTRKRT